MFSSDQLALVFVALVIVGLTLAGMLAVVLVAGRRSRAARPAATRPRGTPADLVPPPEARVTFPAATQAGQATQAGDAAAQVAPAAPASAAPAMAVAADGAPSAPSAAAAPAMAAATAAPATHAAPTPATYATPTAYGAAPAAPPGSAGPPSPEPYPAGPVPSAPSPTLASAPPEAPVFDSTMPHPAGPGQPPTEDAAAALPAEVERERRFTFDMRAHDPRADDAIAGYLGLDPAGRRDAGPPLDPLVDPATGLDTLLAWERILAEESHRYARYRRPVSIVVAELDGLTRLVDRVGAEAARRVLPAVGDALRRHARRTDRVAHAGGGRFLMLLPETDEIQAINYVERVRLACERWLEAGAVALRLSVGWASPTGAGGLETALRTAEDRMYAERHRGTSPGAPSDRPS